MAEGAPRHLRGMEVCDRSRQLAAPGQTIAQESCGPSEKESSAWPHSDRNRSGDRVNRGAVGSADRARTARVYRADTGVAASLELAKKVKELGLEPFRPAPPNPPIDEFEVRLICWIAVDNGK